MNMPSLMTDNEFMTKLAVCCQACLGRNEPHTCPPSTTADERLPYQIRLGNLDLQVWGIPERFTNNGIVHRRFQIKATDGEKNASAFVSIPIETDLETYLETSTLNLV